MADELVRQSRDLLDGARAENEQLTLLEPVTPEDMALAREQLGPKAGEMAVLRAAREGKRGRPKGSRNRRSDDFAKYLLGFGQHPAVTMMQIQSSDPEVLVERSKTIDLPKRRMSYADAQALRIRCAEALLPYLESKKPVAVDMTFTGVADLFIEGVTHTAEEIADVIDAEFLPLDCDDDDGSAGE